MGIDGATAEQRSTNLKRVTIYGGDLVEYRYALGDNLWPDTVTR
jgi:hypothetical protein